MDAVHGLYYLLMHGWMAVGTSPAVMRIPSVIAMVVAVALTVIIGRRLTGSGWAGLFAGLIVALTPTISYYAQTARSYALVFACVVGSTLALLHALAAEARAGGPGPGGRPGGGSGRASGRTLAGLRRAAGGRRLPERAVPAGRWPRTRSRCCWPGMGGGPSWHWAVAAAVSVIVVLPLAALSAREDAAVAWIPRPGLWSLRILFHDYFGATTALAVLLFCCAVAAVLPPLHRGRRAPGPAWWSQGGVSLPSVAAPLLVVPGALLILESLVARPLYVDRYVLYGEAGAALLAGAGAVRIGRWLAGADRPADAALGPGRGRLRAGPGPAARAAAAGPHPAEPAVRLRRPVPLSGRARAAGRRGPVLQQLLPQGPARLPGDYRNVSDFAMAQSPAAAGNFQGRDKPVATVQSLMTGYQRIWVVGRSPFAHLTAGPVRAEDAVLHQPLLPRRETALQGHLRHALGAPLTTPSRPPPPPGGRRPGWLRMPRRSS